MKTLRTIALATAALLLSIPLTGCLIAGYSSGSGFFIWPGSLLLTLIALVLFFVMRRR